MPARFVIVFTILFLTIIFPSFATLLTEWLWFGEVGYQSVFVKSLITKSSLGFGTFLIGFTILFLNLRLALKGHKKPYTLFPGGGDIQPIVIEPKQLGLLIVGISALLAIFVGGIASSQWLVTLQFLNATPFGCSKSVAMV